jgi:vacuolar-type H+-ATPase subunit I/STV1
MAISLISKFHIFAHLSIKESLLGKLQRLGCLEITHIEEKLEFHNWKNIEEDINNNSTVLKLNNVKFCIDLLSNYGNGEKKGLNSLFTSKKVYRYAELLKIAEQFDHESLFTQCKSLDSELSHLKLDENRLITAKQEIQKWQELELDFKEIEQRKYIEYTLGTIAKKNFNNLMQDIGQQDKTAITQIIKEEKNRLYIALIALKENFSRIEPILQKHHFEIYKYSYPFTGTPKKILKSISEQMDSITKKRLEIEKILAKLYRENPLVYP